VEAGSTCRIGHHNLYFLILSLKIPWAMGERQMLPRQTNKTLVIWRKYIVTVKISNLPNPLKNGLTNFLKMDYEIEFLGSCILVA
jgi:hypothetical protein